VLFDPFCGDIFIASKSKRFYSAVITRGLINLPYIGGVQFKIKYYSLNRKQCKALKCNDFCGPLFTVEFSSSSIVGRKVGGTESCDFFTDSANFPQNVDR